MFTARLTAHDRPEVWWESDPTVRVRADFPLSAAKGSDNTAIVYFELDPGKALGRHTDSAEEVLLVLQGTVEATVGDEIARLTEGDFVLVPEMVPHGIRNVGTETARVVGVFSKGRIVATFDEAYEPIGQRVFEF